MGQNLEVERWKYPWRERPLNPTFFRDGLHDALRSLGKLEGVLSMTPTASPIFRMLARKEAVGLWNLEYQDRLSVGDLLLYELGEPPWFAKGSPLEDVSRLDRALRYHPGKASSLISIDVLRLKRELFGPKEAPSWRTRTAWEPGRRPDAGHARHTYFDPALIPSEIQQWTTFVRDSEIDALVKTALAHTRLELIRPFDDGNAVVAGVILHLLLLQTGMASRPILCLSEYLIEDLHARGKRLQEVSRVDKEQSRALWEKHSVVRLLTAVRSSADFACEKIPALLRTFAGDKAKVRSLGRASDNTMKAYRLLQRNGITSAPAIRDALRVSFPTAKASLAHLERRGIIRRIRGLGRSRLFAYQPYLRELNAMPNLLTEA